MVLLSYRFFHDGADRGNISQQSLREPMSFFEIFRAVVGRPNLPFAVFPDQRLERQIESNTRSRKHQGRAGLWTAENQQLGGGHSHADLLGLSTVVDDSEKRDSLRLQNILESFHRRFNRVNAYLVNDS